MEQLDLTMINHHNPVFRYSLCKYPSSTEQRQC